MSGWLAGACAAVLATAAVPAVRAQEAGATEPTSAREQARVLYEAGAAAFDGGDFATARAKFEESYALFASLRTLFSLGVCQHALGDFAAAVRSLDQYLREAGAEAPAELRAQAEMLLGEMRAQLGRLDVRVNVEDAEILVDGVVAGRSPLAAPVEVGPGWHVVEARREGFRGEPQRVNASPGEVASVALALEELPAPPPPPVEPPPPLVEPLYGPPAGVAEKDWYGISDSAYEDYVYSTGRHQPLANWILERNRENPDLDLGIILSGSQGLAWMLTGTLVYVLHEEDKVDRTNDAWAMPWMSFFTWLLGSALLSSGIIMIIVDALDLGKVAVEHPERLIAAPGGAAVPAPAVETGDARDERSPVQLGFGLGGLELRF
ncbi:MAG: PEGA domain-containing protein [Deltaproteobacteria bacterium]|nr:PEGA domain-containing protein [Deltaproteobacteria bacterium]